jgi:hypothetical protein
MLLTLLIIPLFGIFAFLTGMSYQLLDISRIKKIALITSIFNLIVSLTVLIKQLNFYTLSFIYYKPPCVGGFVTQPLQCGISITPEDITLIYEQLVHQRIMSELANSFYNYVVHKHIMSELANSFYVYVTDKNNSYITSLSTCNIYNLKP